MGRVMAAHVARARGPEFGHQRRHGRADLLGVQALREIGFEDADLFGFLVHQVGARGKREGSDRGPGRRNWR